jgi:putative transposase
MTVCSKNRKYIFANTESMTAILEAWDKADYWLVGKFMIMPDHVHFFCAPGTSAGFSLKRWVRYWKSLVSLSWPRSEEQPIWQNDFWDTKIRSGDHYTEKWEYVRNNPVRQGLVTVPDDWPFQGVMNNLQGHD